MSKKIPITIILAVIFFPFCTFGQTAATLWLEKAEESILPMGNKVINPLVYRTTETDTTSLKSTIFQAPHESAINVKNSGTILTVPLPDGSSEDFRIVLYDMMEPGLSERFPEIKTGYGVSTGKSKSTIRFDWTYRGFHAFIRNHGNTVFIDPYSFGDKVNYLSYYSKDYPAPAEPFVCHVEGPVISIDDTQAPVEKAGDCIFRSYRLAMATTGQYSNYHGAMSAAQANLVLSAVTTTMNRVNGVYEQDATIRMILIANTVDVFYYSGVTDPYTNNDGGAMLDENQSNLDAVIGSSNYDIGHVFSTGGGGVAQLNCPCTSSKARGVTGSSNPVGDPFDIDYVAHEMGHQWGANHTQNNSCNRHNSTAMEPGSASTIMGYAGICPPNIQAHSDAYFHGISIQEMANFIVNGNGNNCDVPLAFSNTGPTVSAGSNYTIPVSTPFVLTAVGTDPQNDPMTYCWEQWDNEVNNTMPPTAFNTQGPVFRSFDPVPAPERYFPRLPDLVNNISPLWEVLPAVTRTMEFRVTARDFNGPAGCTDTDNMFVTTNVAAGPFVVNIPSLPVTWTEGQIETVTWNVAGTTSFPVSCANVDILLSYDGGYTYPVTLASGVPNNGSANITVPVGTSISARVMVICSDNIFFDISNNNFTIQQATIPDYGLAVSPNDLSVCGNENAVYTIDVASLVGYTNPVILSVSNLPFGASASFSSNPVIPGNSATMTISNLHLAAGGDYTLTIQANSIAGSKSVNVNLELLSLPETITLMNPGNNETDVALSPSLNWLSDISATYYQVQVATDPEFNSIIINDSSLGTSYTIQLELMPNTPYFWRVKGFNDHCEGPWSDVWSFTSLPCSFFSNLNDLTIPSIGTVNSVINIPPTGTITDVNVAHVTGTHSYVGDLAVSLIAPDNTQVTLFSGICTSDDNFNLGFDDETSFFNIPCPPTSGLIYQPEGNLSDFIGTDLSGNWTLRIVDQASGDGGQLNEWELRVCATNSTLLPVELTEFNAKPLQQTIMLNWATASEFNNTGFEIERRSEFEPDFNAIGWVNSLGNMESGTNNYSFEDNKPIPGVLYYYRLRQIDFDGKESFSNIKSAIIQGEENTYLVFPNPVNNTLYIHCTGSFHPGTVITLTDARGSKLNVTKMQDGQTAINMELFPAGIYFLHVDSESQHWVRKVFK